MACHNCVQYTDIEGVARQVFLWSVQGDRGKGGRGVGERMRTECHEAESVLTLTFTLAARQSFSVPLTITERPCSQHTNKHATIILHTRYNKYNVSYE